MDFEQLDKRRGLTLNEATGVAPGHVLAFSDLEPLEELEAPFPRFDFDHEYKQNPRVRGLP